MDDDYSKQHKKHKKHKKHKRETKKHSKHSSSDSEDEWVEKNTDRTPTKSTAPEDGEEPNCKDSKDRNNPCKKREEWMSLEMDFTSFSHTKEIKRPLENKDPPSEESGQSSRELNPYWRDGGTGLPPEKNYHLEKSKDHPNSGKYGVMNKVQDERRKHERNYELAKTDKSRYSSNCVLGKSYEVKQKDSREEYVSTHQIRVNREENSKLGQLKSERDRRKTFQMPNYDDVCKSDSGQVKRDKHLDEYANRNVDSKSKKGWKKYSETKESSPERIETSSNSESNNVDNSVLSSTYEMSLIKQQSQKVLSKDELNMLCANLMKAEMKGDKQLVEKLQRELDNARGACNIKNDDKDKEIIILTETDNKGFSRPLKSVREERLNSKRKVETHEGGKRVRYFADDDSQSLSEMFEKERFASSREQNATFMKLMGKEMSGKHEDAFEETASVENRGRQDRKDWNEAIREHNQKEKALDNCYWCLGSKNMNQDVIVAVRNQVQLCVPSSQSLTDGHCIIVPNEHIPCATSLDEDVWEDVMSLRKNLVKMFEAEGEDIIFFECVSNLDKFPHMQLHCVPVPKETGDVAPIYFKKAIMECEMEWSNNKKVVDLSGRNVRKAIPKGLPYFAVDFGMQAGYAHVIEDKKLFPNNFAQAIIGGMLDIDHSKWRKLHKDDQENIRQKADYLKQLIQKHL